MGKTKAISKGARRTCRRSLTGLRIFGFFYTATARQRFDAFYFFARLFVYGGVADMHQPVYARVRVWILRYIACRRYPCFIHSGYHPFLWVTVRAGASRAGPFTLRPHCTIFGHLLVYFWARKRIQIGDSL